MGFEPAQKTFPWWRLIAAGVSVGGLSIILCRLDLKALGEAIQQAQMMWLGLGFIGFGVASGAAAWRWHLMLRLTGTTVHPLASLRAVLMGHFFNALLFGPAGGDFAKSALYARWYQYPVSDVLAASFLDRLLGGAGSVLLGMLTLGLAALCGAFRVSQHIEISPAGIEFVVVAVVGGLMLAGLLWRRTHPAGGSFFSRAGDSFRQGLRRLLATPRQACAGFLLGLLVQFCWCSLLALNLRAVTRVEIPWAQLLWTFPAIAVLATLPISVAGAGVREGAALVLLGLYGIPKTDAVAAAMLTLLAYVLWSAWGGLLLWRETSRLERRPLPALPRSISVVIPALNEALALPDTLAHLRLVPEIIEVIVVDGGSGDETVRIAEMAGCRVITGAPGRGGQMRLGAARARGDVILLLHADTWLPAAAGQAVLACLRDVTVAGGGFWKQFRSPAWLMRGSRLRCLPRLLLAGRVMGDQGFFVRRELLEKIGGVPDVPLMEEFELCRRLRKEGRIMLAGATVSTSARRFEKLGVVRTYLRMGRVALLYALGKPPQELKRIYEKE